MTHGKNRLLFGVPSRHSSLISTAEFRLKEERRRKRERRRWENFLLKNC